jgi:transposase
MMSVLRQVEVKDYTPIGPAEGHLNHLKLLKRQSYGRVGLESLSQRLLAS